jgi:hypothetical protein
MGNSFPSATHRFLAAGFSFWPLERSFWRDLSERDRPDYCLITFPVLPAAAIIVGAGTGVAMICFLPGLAGG